MIGTQVFSRFVGKSIESGDDGQPRAVLVTGKVTGDQLDLDQQIVDKDWARGAIAEWHTRAANVREMHQPSAVGKGIEWREEPDGFYLTARISDPAAVRKVIDGVYTGYSIGIKSPLVVPDQAARRGRIRGGVMAEISVVDAPCLPDATLGDVQPLWKMAGADDDEPTGQAAQTGETGGADDLEKSAIPHKDGEPQSPPKGFPKKGRDYGDPANFSWPLDKPSRVRSAMAYYNGGKGKAKYSAEEWATLGRRIAAKARKVFGGSYSLQDGKIVRTDAGKVVDFETLVDDVPVLVKATGEPILPNARFINGETGDPTIVFADTAYKAFPPPPGAARDGFAAPGDQPRDAMRGTPAPAQGGGTTGPNGQMGTGPSAAGQFRTPQPAIGAPSDRGVTVIPTSQIVTGPNAFPVAPGQVAPPTQATDGGGAFRVPPSAIAPTGITKDAADQAKAGDGADDGDANSLQIRQNLWSMLSAEVTEDGGSGQCVEDIKNIARAYKYYCTFAGSEAQQHDGVVPTTPQPMDKAAWRQLRKELRTAVAALQPADLVEKAAARKARRAEKAAARKATRQAKRLLKDAAAPTGAGCGCCDQCTCTGHGDAAATKALEATVATLTKERDDLRKELDITPAPGGPARFAPPPAPGSTKGEPTEAERREAERRRLLAELATTQGVETRLAIAQQLYALR